MNECDCPMPVVPDAFGYYGTQAYRTGVNWEFCHSHYYLETASFECVSPGDAAYVISHLYPDEVGQLCEEFDYTNTGGMVTMRPRGATGTKYHHRDPAWMLNGFLYTDRLGRQIRACGSVLRAFGEKNETLVYVFGFTLCDFKLTRGPKPDPSGVVPLPTAVVVKIDNQVAVKTSPALFRGDVGSREVIVNATAGVARILDKTVPEVVDQVCDQALETAKAKIRVDRAIDRTVAQYAAMSIKPPSMPKRDLWESDKPLDRLIYCGMVVGFIFGVPGFVAKHAQLLISNKCRSVTDHVAGLRERMHLEGLGGEEVVGKRKLFRTREYEEADGYGSTRLDSNVGDTVCLGFGDEAKLGDNCVITIKGSKRDCDPDAIGATLLSTATRISYVCRKCPCNAHNAMCNRHGTKTPAATAAFSFGHYDAFVKEAATLYVEKLPYWWKNWINKWPFVKQRLISVSEMYDTLRANWVKCMVKREGNHKLPTKARCIQYYPNLLTQAIYGPEFTALQKTYTEIFQRREVFGGVRLTIASGMNSSALGRWLGECLADIPNPTVYERDGKNWDGCMQRLHHGMRMKLYEFCGADFMKFVQDGNEVVGLASFKTSRMKYKLSHTTKSGQNDTTLYNSLMNGIIACESMEKLGLKGDVIVAGDDLLAIIEGDFEAKALADIEATYGIVPEYRTFKDVRHASFISGVFFPNSKGWGFVPKPGRLLARLMWTVNPPSQKLTGAYLSSVSQGILSIMRGFPIIDPWLRGYVTGESCSFDKKSLIIFDANFESDDVTREAFKERYGLTNADIESAELALTADYSPRILKHPVLERICAVDLNDLVDRDEQALW